MDSLAPPFTLACDPGKSGGFAYRDESGAVQTLKMPDTEGSVVSLLSGLKRPAATLFLELVSGYAGGKGQTGSSMFVFGSWWGLVLGAAMALGYRIELVRPQTWQKPLGMGTKAAAGSYAEWKRKLRGKAEQLFPGVPVTLATADALLILSWAEGRR